MATRCVYMLYVYTAAYIVAYIAAIQCWIDICRSREREKNRSNNITSCPEEIGLPALLRRESSQWRLAKPAASSLYCRPVASSSAFLGVWRWRQEINKTERSRSNVWDSNRGRSWCLPLSSQTFVQGEVGLIMICIHSIFLHISINKYILQLLKDYPYMSHYKAQYTENTVSARKFISTYITLIMWEPWTDISN